jgi:hypothetical protein
MVRPEQQTTRECKMAIMKLATAIEMSVCTTGSGGKGIEIRHTDIGDLGGVDGRRERRGGRDRE